MEPNELFRKYKTVLIRQVGRRALYDTTLDSIAQAVLKTKLWQGVHGQSDAVFRAGYQIINTTSKGPGEHWVALFIKGKTVFAYDTFGRASRSLLKGFYAKAKAKGYVVKDSDYDAEQRGDSEICGILALSWLLVVQKLGIKKALEI